MKSSSTASTPAAYIDGLAEPHRSDIRTLDALIQEIAPELTPSMLGGMPSYGTYHYKYASGREGDWAVVSCCSRANYISLSICALDEGGYIAERYQKELPKAKIGKSCIRFQKLADIDQAILREIIEKAASWWKKLPKNESGTPQFLAKKSS